MCTTDTGSRTPARIIARDQATVIVPTSSSAHRQRAGTVHPAWTQHSSRSAGMIAQGPPGKTRSLSTEHKGKNDRPHLTLSCTSCDHEVQPWW